MQVKTYTDILSFIKKNLSNHLQCLNALRSKYPEFTRSTIVSIMGQEMQRKVKKTIHLHTSTKKALEYYASYKKKETNDNDIIYKMAVELDLSPCLLARIILEQHMKSTTDNGVVNKRDISRLMKETHLIDDVILSKNISLCVLADKFYGPIADLVNRSTGHEYEIEMKRKLQSYNIPFHDETYLRSRGYDKTPDAVLQMPIAVKNRVINWVESKALFADHLCHHEYLTNQYSAYVNRFGPGLVIYWLGYTSDLDAAQSDSLSIVDHFPTNFVTLNVVLR